MGVSTWRTQQVQREYAVCAGSWLVTHVAPEADILHFMSKLHYGSDSGLGCTVASLPCLA